jgi:hypothetical protein
MASGDLWNLLVLFSSWIIAFNSDDWVHLNGFLNNPAENKDSPKLVEFITLNP